MNLLCYFAFDLGAQRCRVEGNKITLYFKFNKELLDEAIKQLVGTRGYNDFVNSLTEEETICLRFLSKSVGKATIEELTLLLRLNQFKDSLQEMPISKVCNRIREYEVDVQNVASLMKAIIEKGENQKIFVLNSTIIGKPMYEVEDQWIRSYFKYGWTEADIELELGLRPKFGGIRVFGDPVATTIHSVFFPRISEHIGSYPAQNFKAHTGFDNGRYLHPQKERQLLIASYIREADSSAGHYAVNLDSKYEVELLKREVDELLFSLKEAGFIDNSTTAIFKE